MSISRPDNRYRYLKEEEEEEEGEKEEEDGEPRTIFLQPVHVSFLPAQSFFLTSRSQN